MNKASTQEAVTIRGGQGFNIPALSTGSVVLDYLIGGTSQCPGIPRGRITEFYGEAQTGKTTIALETAAKCLSVEGTACYLDCANQFPAKYAQAIGVDTSSSKWYLYMPSTWEEVTTLITTSVAEGADLIVVDTPPQFGELSILTEILHASGTALVFLNTMCRLPNSNRLAYDAGSLKYYASLRIKLSRLGGEGSPYRLLEAECVKNMVSFHQGHHAPFVIREGDGIDNVRSVIDIAQTRGLLVEGSDGLVMDVVGRTFESKEGLCVFFEEHPDQFAALVERMTTTENT